MRSTQPHPRRRARRLAALASASAWWPPPAPTRRTRTPSAATRPTAPAATTAAPATTAAAMTRRPPPPVTRRRPRTAATDGGSTETTAGAAGHAAGPEGRPGLRRQARRRRRGRGRRTRGRRPPCSATRTASSASARSSSRCSSPATTARCTRSSARASRPTPTTREWTIKVRAGISFTDGTPLDADAVIDNFNRTWTGLLVQGAMRDVAKGPDGKILATKVDDMTFTLQTGKNGDPNTPVPWPTFPQFLTGQPGFIASPTWLAAVEGDRRPRHPAGRHRAVHRAGVHQRRPHDGRQEPELLAQGRQGRPAPVPRLDRVPRDPGRPGPRPGHAGG